VDTISYKTKSANAATVNKQWLVVDAEGQSLGRLASMVAKLIRGKYKPDFTPHVDCGDNVIIVNASKVRLGGSNWDNREHFSHTGFPGSQRRVSPKEIFDKNPERLIEKAVKGMLPKNRLGRDLYRNLYVYSGDAHKHEAQQPKSININDLK